MNSLAIVAFFAALAVTNAAPSATIIQGPSARSTVVGSDGSVISSVAPGAQIVAEEHPGVVAHAAPVVAPAYAAHSVPVVAAHTAYAAPFAAARTAYAAPFVAAHSAYAAPVVAEHTAYATPVVAAHTAYAAPVVAAHAPVLSAYAAPVAAHGVVGHSTVDTVVAGPSGTIATSKTVASPAVVAAYGVHGYAAHGLHYY